MKRLPFNAVQIAALLVFGLALAYLGWLSYGLLPKPTPAVALAFDGASALQLAQAQCDLGPRPAATTANRRAGDWIMSQLRTLGWRVEEREFTWNGLPVRNILARLPTQGGADDRPILLLGAHYDTRLVADQDPDPLRRSEPIVGGNDGASGVAVLLELARVLDRADLNSQVWLAFFDAEDNGRLPSWEEWAIGSSRLAAELDPLPTAMILLDMVGDADQRFLYEGNSDPALSQQIWELAARLGFAEVFVPAPGPTLIDDHLAFVRRGVRAVDIVDFEYPYYHTTADTCDKLSAQSLERVGRVVEVYIEEGLLDALTAPAP